MTAARFLAGAHLERRPGRKYLASLRFAELTLPSPVPRAATLKRWRSELPEGFEVAIVAPKDAVIGSGGPLRFDETMEAAVTRLVDSAAAISATAVVLEHGSEVTTGQRDRDLLARWFERFASVQGLARVWAPSGLWEADAASRFAERLGATYAVDPLEDDVPQAPFVYARLPALGGRMRFSAFLLEKARDAILEADPARARVAIRSERSFREALDLQRLFGSALADAAAAAAAAEGDDTSDDDATDDWDADEEPA